MRAPITLAVLLLLAAPAWAGDPVVVAVDGEDVLVDLGTRDGVGAGATLELLHPIVVTDPVTGERLEDRFAIGLLTVTRAGDGVSVASASPELRKRIRPGDPVALVSARKTFRDPWEARLAARQEAAGVAARPRDERAREVAARRVADAEATRAVWRATLGQPPEARIAAWRTLLDERPGSAYAPAIRAELDSLEAQRQAIEAAARARASLGHRDDLRARRLEAIDPAASAGSPLFGAAPGRAIEGRDLVLAFAMREPAAVADAWLYVRGGGATSYARIPMSRSGDAYLRARVPIDAVRPPALDYFVEVAPADGAPPVAALGSEDAPRRIAIDRREVDPVPPRQGRSRVTLTGEYVDFDGGLADGHDQYYQVEADFMYRFYRPVYAMRLGFGTLDGKGGPVSVIDADPSDRCLDEGGRFRCERLTYSYIYAELEHRFSDVVAVMIRPQAGRLTTDRRLDGGGDRCQGADNADCEYDRGLGLRLRLRLGEEIGTNLALGVGATTGVGTLLEAAFAWNASAALPVRIAVQVTDMPVTTDFGVRLVGDLGWRSLAWMYPSLRLSYQARDVDHAGFSGGVAVNFDW